MTRLAILDVAPTKTMYARTDRAFAEAYYHWFFLIQPFDLPERLIGSEADYFLQQILKSWCKREGAISEAAMAAYVTAFKASGAIHAACEDYRAAATIDLEHDRADDLISHRVAVPMLVLWGGRVPSAGNSMCSRVGARNRMTRSTAGLSTADTSCPKKRLSKRLRSSSGSSHKRIENRP